MTALRIGFAAFVVAGAFGFGRVEARAIGVTAVLTATSSAPGARGTARLLVRDTRRGLEGRFEVRVRKLAPDARYELRIDDVPVGRLDTSRRGRGRVRFGTRPRGHVLRLGVDPRGRALALVGDDGTVALTGRLSDDSIDRSKVRCCLPDDSGSECEDRTPAACAAGGGLDLGPGSCLPDPCGSSTSTAATRCCLPDDSGPECEDRTSAQCSAQGGIDVGPGSCTPNPCIGSVTTTTTPGGTTTTLGAGIEVICERRTDRSKISVNGNGLATGSYRARVTSGGASVTSAALPTVGDEVEFDFDSDPADIAAGATAIAAGFIQGVPYAVHGQILDAGNGVVAEATRTCTVQ